MPALLRKPAGDHGSAAAAPAKARSSASDASIQGMFSGAVQ
jgi:hypothetical protein